MLLILPDVPLRTGSFALADRWLLWTRVRVYPDRVELVGWSFTGRDHRHIPLDRIAEIDHDGRHLQLQLQDGDGISLLVDEAASWARLIRAQRDVYGDRQ